MVYEYQCATCHHRFDVVKSAKDFDRNENCTQCGEFAVRMFVPQRVYLNHTKVEHPEYNPGLGCVIKNKRHKQDLLKAKGLEEVGNDFGSGEKMVDHYEAERAAKMEKAYDDV